MMDSIGSVRGETGIIYDDRMADHRCLWDSKFPECPERYTRVIERYCDKSYYATRQLNFFCRCRELKLIDRCVSLSPRDATVEEILTKHTKEHYELLKTTSECTNAEKLEELSSKFDAIYIHPVSTYRKETLQYFENFINSSFLDNIPTKCTSRW